MGGAALATAALPCRLDEECATTDATCCNFYKARLLDFTARLLAAHGLQQEWFAVYGAVIGAVRDPEGMLPFDRVGDGDPPLGAHGLLPWHCSSCRPP